MTAYRVALLAIFLIAVSTIAHAKSETEMKRTRKLLGKKDGPIMPTPVVMPAPVVIPKSNIYTAAAGSNSVANALFGVANANSKADAKVNVGKKLLTKHGLKKGKMDAPVLPAPVLPAPVTIPETNTYTAIAGSNSIANALFGKADANSVANAAVNAKGL